MLQGLARPGGARRRRTSGWWHSSTRSLSSWMTSIQRRPSPNPSAATTRTVSGRSPIQSTTWRRSSSDRSRIAALIRPYPHTVANRSLTKTERLTRDLNPVGATASRSATGQLSKPSVLQEPVRPGRRRRLRSVSRVIIGFASSRWTAGGAGAHLSLALATRSEQVDDSIPVAVHDQLVAGMQFVIDRWLSPVHAI